MEIDKTTYQVSGTKTPQTKEKIRLKLRLLLNNYKKCEIGITSFTNISKKAFYLGEAGFKHFVVIYKSNSKDSVTHYLDTFKAMYRNEVKVLAEDDTDKAPTKPFVLFIVGRSKKRVF